MNRTTKGTEIVGNLKQGTPGGGLAGTAGIASFTMVGSLARTDTAAKNLFVLPVGAVVLSIEVWTNALSNAGTSANISIGKTGTNTFYVNAFDVKGSVLNAQNFPAATNLFATALAAAQQVVGIYAETGTASTLGGPFLICLEYYIP